MKILVVVATTKELVPSLRFLHENQVEYLVTGVGMIATAFALGKHLQGKKYDLILNIGICGSLDRGTKLGQVIRINQDSIFELGAEDHGDFLSIADIGMGESFFTEQTDKKTNSLLSDLPIFNGITVNKIHGSYPSIQKLLDNHSLQTAESMEGAAIFYAARQMALPVLQIRSISNYIEPRNRGAWEMNKAIASINRWLQGFLIEYLG